MRPEIFGGDIDLNGFDTAISTGNAFRKAGIPEPLPRVVSAHCNKGDESADEPWSCGFLQGGHLSCLSCRGQCIGIALMAIGWRRHHSSFIK